MEKARAEDAADAFKRAFASVSPLVLEEWPGLDQDALAATEGDFDRVTSLVVNHTDRTRVVVRRKLGELLAVIERGDGEKRTNGVHALPDRAKGVVDQMDDVLAAIKRLESFASEEAKRVGAKMIPAAEAKVQKSPWVSLLLALGLGLILGLWLNGGRRR